jgi:hypothetical protein
MMMVLHIMVDSIHDGEDVENSSAFPRLDQ